MLGSEVVGLRGDVDVRPDLVEHLLPVGQLEVGDLAHQRPRQVGVEGHVHVPVLVAAQAEVHLGHAGAEGAHEDRPPLDVVDVCGALLHALEAAGVDGVGPGVGLDVVGADGARQRRGGGLVVEAAVRSSAQDPELVEEALVLAVVGDLLAEAVRSAGADQPHVRTQPLEDVVVDAGQALRGVDDADLGLGQPQRRPQPLVGLGVDAAVARAGEVARDAVGLPMLQRREDACS